jgi:adenylate cyclase class 2
MTETEIKLRWPEERGDPWTFLERHGFHVVQPRTLEFDQLFDRSSGELRSSDRILRLRQAGGNAIVTYKGPADRARYKSREEIEFNVSDAERFRLVLDRLGFARGFRYEKFRTTFSRNGEEGIVTIDETPMGIFLELEGAESWIDATAVRLGFTQKDYVTASYVALYHEFRRGNPDAPADMVF